MECLTGYDAAILVDAAEFPDRPTGEVRYVLASRIWPTTRPATSTRPTTRRCGPPSALGRRLGADLPARIETVTVQAHRTDEFSEELSPAVLAAFPAAASAVVELLGTEAALAMHQAVLAQAVLDKAVERAQSLGAAAHRRRPRSARRGRRAHRGRSTVRLGRGVDGNLRRRGRISSSSMTPGDGLRLAAMDVERNRPETDKRPTEEEGAIG